ncbi:MutT/NUDIX hydrolase [Acinetobacter phage vB_AbaM_Kimel]|uniref:Putative ADP-ribose pyrophosphatase protein n=3 Tax=Lazarusvirus kimel TaxID=2843635 RepID=A0A6B9LZC9_9CAUD|nr:MutT/NUDIX hydrolase [Acinetobacter phage vB_AbaM_Kimel]QHB48370.1 putative ADP-ribose pyrophosphatase protein [Acinetobacter phage vB_AbaM_Kimel]QKE55912.1 putative ADP-ribose pyrophosphatase protein [Acinetobacter phage Octan]QNO11333.1 putative ADP-ribose pyrophosphatase protein [Acinetobacter phage Meroveus]
MRYAACVLIENNGKFLAVSRKDDLTDFGLPGGKVNLGETIVEGAKRECLEETGIWPTVLDLSDPYIAIDGEFEVSTFHAIPSSMKPYQPLAESETGLVEWVTADKLMEGTFGEYNRDALLHFGYIKKYLIWYTHDRKLNNPPNDLIYASSSTEAIKKFIRATAGQYYVHHCEEVQ